MQSLLLNEYDEQARFYRLFAAEDFLRRLAEDFPNLYQVGIFTSQRRQLSIPTCARRPSSRGSEMAALK